MSDKNMVRFCTLGLSMLFERKEPDINEPMRSLRFKMQRNGVTDGKVTKLLRDLMKQDCVLVDEEFIERSVDDWEKHGGFNVVAEIACCPQLAEKYGEYSIVKGVTNEHWYNINKGGLKQAFPDLLEGRFFCRLCDFEKKEELDPCGNGECRMGLANFRQIQETNTMLQAQLEMVQGDAGLAAALADVKARHSRPECPYCEGTNLDLPDMEGDVYCNDCDMYHNNEDDDHEC